MLWVYDHNKYISYFSAGIRLYTSQSDIYIRQIMTWKDGPRAERVKYNYIQLLLVLIITNRP